MFGSEVDQRVRRHRKELFFTICPKFVRDAAEVTEEILKDCTLPKRDAPLAAATREILNSPTELVISA
jgi:hypothetical protein